jgi:hypothetical protein
MILLRILKITMRYDIFMFNCGHFLGQQMSTDMTIAISGSNSILLGRCSVFTGRLL